MHIQNIFLDAERGVSVHAQPSHDGMPVILEVKASFREFDELQHVGPGRVVSIPRNTRHGRVRATTAMRAALCVRAADEHPG